MPKDPAAHDSFLCELIICLSDGSEDPDTTPYLEIADQRGNPLKIPHQEKKVEHQLTGVFLL